jgi:hypothetical protein
MPLTAAGEVVRRLDACGQGEVDDARALLSFHAVSLSDFEAMTLETEAQVLEAAHRQIQALRVANLQRSEMLASEMVALNATSVLHKVDLSRRQEDGTAIGRVRATFLLTIGADGPRIAVLARRDV